MLLLVGPRVYVTYLWDCKEANPGHDYEGHCVEPTVKRKYYIYVIQKSGKAEIDNP